ncbi:MAG: YhdP family protein, partial [Gammaproteobacteria bacterium]
MTAFWRKVVVNLGYLAASFIILSAFIVSATRLLTPVLNEHRAEFENFASRLLDKPVHIDQIEISWNVYEPELAFKNVSLLDPDTKEHVFQIPLITIDLDIIRSLLSRQPILDSLKITGVHLTLREQQSGQMNVEGLRDFAITDNFTGQSQNANAVFAWIFLQPSLVLKNIELHFVPLEGNEKFISVRWLALTNTTTSHRLTGKAILHQDVPTQVKINFNWKGSVTDLEHVSAELALELEGISLPQWFSKQQWHNLHIIQGLGSAKILANWNQNKWQKIQSTLQFYDIEAESLLTKTPIIISHISGNIGMQRNANQMIIDGKDLLIELPDHSWPKTNFLVKFTESAEGLPTVQYFEATYFDLADSYEVLKASGLLPPTYQSKITILNPKGQLHNLKADIHGALDDPANVSLNAEFKDLSLSAWGQIPTLKNLQGAIAWDGKQGDLKLDSHRASLVIDTVFANPLAFDQLTGWVHWQKETNGNWTFTAKEIQAMNADIKASANVTLTIPTNDSPSINLLGKFTLDNAAHISRYLPLKIWDAGLNEWLRNAFLSGRVDSGTAILQGRLSDFPFDKGVGKFSISGVVNGIELHYAPNWPSLRVINGNLVYSGRSMVIDVVSGQILNIPIGPVQAEIPYFGDARPQVLYVQTTVLTDLAQGMNFIENSPLKDTIGKDLSALQLQGPMQLKLGLVVPLALPENIKIVGDTTLTNANLNIPEWNLSLGLLNGAFRFTEDSITSTPMTGQLFGHPVTLNLGTQLKTDKRLGYVTADLQGMIKTTDLQTWLDIPVDQVMQGMAAYRAQLFLPSHEQKSQPMLVNIKSDFQGIAVNMPASYGKTADQKVDVQFNIMVDTNQPLKAKIIYDKLFTAALTLGRVKQKLSLFSADLHLGTGDATWQNRSGILVTGNLDELDWNKLQPYVAKYFDKKPIATTAEKQLISPDFFRGADLRVNTLTIAGLKLNQIRIQLAKLRNSFQVGLSNAMMSGQIIIPASSGQMIQARFQRLFFSPQSRPSGTNTLSPRGLPPISFVGDDVRYGDASLGRLTLNLVPGQNGLVIRQLYLNSPAYQLNATGDWSGSNPGGSRLHGSVTTANVSKLLTAWGFASTNLIGSDASAQFDLAWPGTPFSPIMSGMSGNVSLKLGKGRIVNIGDSADAKMGLGRLLNIFSLQSIPRRLSLDFSDLFEKGYSFDSMKGDFNLKNGSAFTTNTYFNGPIARIGLAGRIGMAQKDLDMKLGVTAYVTASLP